ncbi:MAG: hypothetical protein EXX96DRAFT_1214 [Benjaminiella poitrasii]|nr:MAG: hypothetical protein EXX96DRAFT_1214 [Benjaminiella poitrasii]
MTASLVNKKKMHYPFLFAFIFYSLIHRMDKKEQKPATTGLLTGAAGAFGAGLLGAIWYTKRKQQKEKAITAAATPTSTVVTAAPAPKMTPAEYAVAKKEASLFAFKTLGYGTLLAFTGAGLIATAVGYWLDVRNVTFDIETKDLFPLFASFFFILTLLFFCFCFCL